MELSWTNAQRLALCMFPPDPEVWAKSYFRICSSIIDDLICGCTQTLLKACQQGFDDARLFLQQNNLIACNQCVSPVNSVANIDLTDINCFECEALKKVSFLGYFLTLNKFSNGIECSHRFQLFHIVDAVNWWFTRGRHSYLGERCYSSKSRTAEQNFTTSENAVTGHFERPLRHTHRCCLWNFNQVRY